MKRFIPLALTVLALAAVPAAFADDGSTPPTTPPATAAPTAQQGQPAQQGQGAENARQRLERLRQRIQFVEQRFARHCGSNSAQAPQACLDFAKKVEDRLNTIDGKIQDRIAKIQQTCGTASTDRKCQNADKRIAFLQALDTHVKALAQKVQDWLNGKTVSTDPGSDSSLDQAAAGLGQLTQQAGGNK
jgi:tetrahydromethanopterin S-methyltransferase subunit G